jgi:X-X-X-Leu-X-X-Gly heptad repeat protein
MTVRNGRQPKQKIWKRGWTSLPSLIALVLPSNLSFSLLLIIHLFRVAREMEEQKKRLRETDPQESLKVGLQTLANKSQKISAGVAAALAVLSASDSDSD